MGTVKEKWILLGQSILFDQEKIIVKRASNFDSERLKVNDKLGNPVMISTILVWRVHDTL